MMRYVLLLNFLICISQFSQAQGAPIYKFDYQIDSRVFGDTREISVYLPPTFYDNPDSKYTVTYVLDGHFDPFVDLVAKTLEYNTYMYNYTPTMVVGIHAKDRGWEFSAPVAGDPDDEAYKGGRAPELQAHFKNEVFPLIDSIYGQRTMDFKNIIGHSSGGKFVLYTLFSDQKDLFDGYIGISPALRPGENTILEDASQKLEKGERFNKFLYCSSGTVGEREELFGGAINQLDSILQKYPDHGLLWTKDAFQGMDHWTCVPPSLNKSMVEVTRAFRVDEQMFNDFARNKDVSMKEQIETFYKERNEIYGFSEVPPGGYIYNIAWDLSDKGFEEEAMAMYDWGISQHPTHYTLRKSKAKLFLKMGDKERALESFRNAQTNLEGVRALIGEEDYQSQKNYLAKKISEISN